ncbi:PKD domain-containing protein [Flavobacterium yafengii]|uniref:PKD domain-containing protein n=1 Tax=Flavobacterium yafengii TaxID=3041253 RepID=UPI0024A8052B|nr:PKD domain-containing protein [Flavobacterium yafengii]MDI5887642.1 PKD domain-containing protein [Flavobacterium yafengii]
MKTKNSIKVFSTKANWIIMFCISLCPFISMFAQELTDKEIGFDKELFKKEIVSNGLVNSENIDIYLAKIREDLVQKKKLGFNNWLASKEKKKEAKNASSLNLAANNRFAGSNCESFTFNDPLSPFIGWVLSNNTEPYEYDDLFTEQVTTISESGTEFLNDIGGYRFIALAPVNFTSQTDPYIGAPPAQVNTSNVVRVGNSEASYRKERISKDFIITNLNDFIFYNFAIVLQDPQHELRPYYTINIYINNEIIPCSSVVYEANSNIPGFNLSPNSSSVWVRPWSSNIIKPSDFGAVLGDSITIEVSVSDCGLGGHFGYGYFDIQCKTEADIIVADKTNVCTNESISFSTQLDGSTNDFSWVIRDTNNNIIPIQNSQSSTLTHTFNQIGTYTVDLSSSYFSTSTNCSTNSIFRKMVEVKDCGPCDYCASFNLIKNEKYLISAWVKENNPDIPQQQFKNYDKGYISVSFIDTGGVSIATPQKFYATGGIIDGWQRIIGEFVVPNNVDDMNLELVNENTDLEKLVYFDDIRILPSKGNMKSFVYDQATQRLMAELDENNYSTFYEYDLEGGLVRIKKETEKGIFTIQETRSGNTKTDKP